MNMINILADASLPYLDALFGKPFQLTRFDTEAACIEALPTQDILLCRSTLKINQQLLKHSTLSCVATASSGTDHIDADYLNTHHMTLFDAKGCNAESVTDYVTSTLAYLKTHNQLPGVQVGVMGAGHVGSRVAKRLKQLGFSVSVYDPLKPNFKSCSLNALKSCKILCIHANLHETQPHPTQHFLNADFLNQLAPNTVIINAARGGIVDEAALLKAQNKIIYCTDVYQNEPDIDQHIIQYATLCTPHIAGHSIEAKYNAVFYLSQKLHAYFNLPMPQNTLPPTPTLNNPPKTWEALALALYDPALETKALKKIQHPAADFVKLRRTHQHRHSFNWEKYSTIVD